MASTETHVATNEERRRSERLPLALPVVVRGESLDANAFQEETFTLSVSAHGALVALATTVTLGQRLLLRNPQTRDEAEAWVTRLGLPRGGLAQIGIEFVRPDADFWSSKPPVKPPIDGADRRTEQGIRERPHPGGEGGFEAVWPGRSDPAPQAQTSLLETRTPAALASSDILLNALEQTLRQAADQAVAAAATARLGAAVNQAAAVIQHFSNVRMRQLEERLVQYGTKLVNSAREDFLSQLQTDVTRTEEHLRKRTEEFIDAAAWNAHDDFAERLREVGNQATVHFVEDTNNSSAVYLARLAEQIQAATSEARTQIETTIAGFKESEEKTRGEMERAFAEARQRAESLTSQLNEASGLCEARLRAFREELARSKEQEVDDFRQRLRSVLTALLASLG